MIRIDTALDTLDRKNNENNGYLDIRSKSELSNKDINDYIKSEFEKAHREAMLEPYDKLLEEIYDVSEDDISIDYEVSDKIKDILSDFKLTNWLTLNESKKLDVINKLVDAVSDDLGITDKPKVVLTTESNDFFGAYDPQKNTIILNRTGFLNPKELVDTITHELRHAYQHMRAQKLETHEDALFRVNLENYISPEQNKNGDFINYFEYNNQYVEVDARVFADKFKEAMK
jgi:predicted SprT family Zn-dependent metalloprotease